MHISEDSRSDHNTLVPAQFSSRAAGTAIWALSSAIGFTWKVSLSGQTNMAPSERADYGRIYAFWHSQLLPLSFKFRDSGIHAIVSRSRDGILASYIAGKWRHSIISGSSHRGGTAVLRQSIKVLNDQGSIAITPDGPRGPREVVKSGAAQLAALSGAPVIILTVKPQQVWRLKSWDRFMIPKPFTRVNIHVSAPLYAGDVPDSNDKVESVRTLIQEKFDVASKLA
ncbi:MAG: lysophospholipid acyltransferase family protein [Chitinispirillaceae bacterium]|nr:lysophospholipid acyltransferase family protein [Chitinispirillaceae bacterium]